MAKQVIKTRTTTTTRKRVKTSDNSNKSGKCPTCGRWYELPSDYIKIKHKVKDIPDIRTFNGLLEASTLSDVDKEIMRLHYLQDKDFGYIADSLGYDKQTVQLRHKRALIKLNKLI